MIESDFKAFSKTWMTAHAVSSSNSSQNNDAIAYVFDILEQYSIISIELAIKKHCEQSRFAPTPADVIALLETRHRHISYGEAWALCPKSHMDTVVWTNEIAQAWAACSDIYNDGDKIGAKMAFKGAYERIRNLAELKRVRPVWGVSIGDNKELIKGALDNAVLAGRLTAEQALNSLPTAQGGGFIGKMLTGGKVSVSDASVKKGIKKLRRAMDDAEKIREDNRLKQLQAIIDEKQKFEDARVAAIEYCNSRVISDKKQHA